jgi:hypothetical protein
VEVVDPLRECVNVESARADNWKARAEAAEAWHWKAAALLAEANRQVPLDFDLKTRIREALKWEPQ